MKTWTSPRPKRVSLHLWLYRHRFILAGILGALVVGGLLATAYLTSVVTSRFEGRRWNLPSRIYSDLVVLRVGDAVSADRLEAKLDRLLYQRDDSPPIKAGHFHRSGSSIEVFTRDFRYPGRVFRGFAVRADLAGGRVNALRDATGAPAPALVIEPERLGSVFGEELEARSLVRLPELPKTLTDAILVTEDRDFYRHGGVSVRRSLGAALANMRGAARQGGSTLTQQLVKNLYLSPERSLKRKAIEAVMALALDARYSKDEIFETYLNEIYLGQRGAVQITGVGEAARQFFGKEASDLDLAE